MPDRPDAEDPAPQGAGAASSPPRTPGSGGAPGQVKQDHDVSAVLKVATFRRLWLALGFSSFGDWVGLLATTAFAAEMAGNSDAAINLAIAGVFILRLAPAALLGPLAGALADRLDRKWTMVVTDLLRGVLFISIPLVHTLTWLYVATILIECLALFFMPAKDATIPNLLPPSRLEVANQLSLATTYGTAPVAALAFSAIALVNGILDNFLDRLATNPTELALHLNGVTFLVSGLVIARLSIPTGRGNRDRGAGEGNLFREILDGWRYVGSTPVVRGIVLGMLGAFAAAGFVIGLAQSYVRDLGAGQPGYGVLFGAVFLGLGIGMWQGPRLLHDFSRKRLFGLSLATAGLFLGVLALVPNIVMAVILTVCVGACGGVSWVTGYTLLGIEVEDEVRGRTFGFVNSTARIVLISVLALGPALAALIGRHTFDFTPDRSLTYGGAAFVFLLGAVLAVTLGLTAYRQMDDRPGASLVGDVRTALTARRSPAPKPGRNTYPGLFVALEGGDGTGKSTQARLLAQWLVEEQGHDVVLTREPGATSLGMQLRSLLLDPEAKNCARAEALMFAADRAQHVATEVRPALARGAVVVTDRFMDSSIAYQGAGRELDAADVERLSRWACDGLVPDLTVVLDLDPVITRGRRLRDAERAGEDGIEQQPEAFHERVRAHFLELARREPHRYVVVDAGESPQEVQEKIRARVREDLPVSARQRRDLEERLHTEQGTRVRRAEAEAEVRRIDADLRSRQTREQQAREESRRRAREEAEREILETPAAAFLGEPVSAVEPADAPVTSPVADVPRVRSSRTVGPQPTELIPETPPAGPDTQIIDTPVAGTPVRPSAAPNTPGVGTRAHGTPAPGTPAHAPVPAGRVAPVETAERPAGRSGRPGLRGRLFGRATERQAEDEAPVTEPVRTSPPGSSFYRGGAPAPSAAEAPTTELPTDLPTGHGRRAARTEVMPAVTDETAPVPTDPEDGGDGAGGSPTRRAGRR